MGIRFSCPNGHKLNVKTFLAGKRAICPQCGAKVVVPDVPSEQAAETSPADEMLESPFAPASPSVGRPQQDTTSPSIVIAVAQNEATAPSPVEAAKPVPVVPTPSRVEKGPLPAGPEVGSSILPESILPESIVAAPTQNGVAAAPVVATAEDEYNLRLERGRHNQILVALGLLVVVVVLAATLIWVLRRREPTRDSTGKTGGQYYSAKFGPATRGLAVVQSSSAALRKCAAGDV